MDVGLIAMLEYITSPPRILNNPALDKLICDLLHKYDLEDGRYVPFACSGTTSFNMNPYNVNCSGIKLRQDEDGYAKINIHM